MDFSEYFPIWHKLTPDQQALIGRTLVSKTAQKNELIHNGSLTCSGLLVVRTGQLRAYMLSDEGREITLYRLFDRDICLFSASCVMRSIQFDILIEAEKESEIWFIPPHIFKQLTEQSTSMANFSNDIMATRFSEVMWLVEQVLWKSMDKRLASFLLEESNIESSDHLHLTHEAIANHIGTHREVITRMLRYFQSEGMVSLSRGSITLTDRKKLENLR